MNNLPRATQLVSPEAGVTVGVQVISEIGWFTSGSPSPSHGAYGRRWYLQEGLQLSCQGWGALPAPPQGAFCHSQQLNFESAHCAYAEQRCDEGRFWVDEPILVYAVEICFTFSSEDT